MGLFGKSKKERETEYMSRLDVPSCLKEDFESVDVHTKERKANGCGYKTEHVGLGLRGISKEGTVNWSSSCYN